MAIDWTQVKTKTEKDQKKLGQMLEALDTNCRNHLDKYVHWSGAIMANDKAKGGKPKAIAMVKWTEDVWTEYYTRVSQLEAGMDVSVDFSSYLPPNTLKQILEE